VIRDRTGLKLFFPVICNSPRRIATVSSILSSLLGLIGFSIPPDRFVEVVPLNLTNSARNWTFNCFPASTSSTDPSNQVSYGRGYKSAVPSEIGQFARSDGVSGVHFRVLLCYLALAIAATVALTARM
jgi:hypothetical protein